MRQKGGDFKPVSEEEAKQWIKRVQNIDIRNRNIDVLKRDIDFFPNGFRMVGIPISKGETIYRARIQDNKPNEVSDLSYPPKHRVGEFGRANRPHNPIFYASSGGAAAVFEQNPNPGDNVAILKWRLKEEITLSKIGYSDEVLRRLNSSRDKVDIPGGLIPDFESPGNSILREFLAKIFTRRVQEDQKHRHKLTAAIAEMYTKSGEIDGILYPTVEMWGNQDNLAIETQVVDQVLEPVSAEYIEIQKRDDKQIKTDDLDTCTTIVDGEFQWNAHGHQWVFDKDGAWGSFKYENGNWKLKNSMSGGARALHDQDFEY